MRRIVNMMLQPVGPNLAKRVNQIIERHQAYRPGHYILDGIDFDVEGDLRTVIIRGVKS